MEPEYKSEIIENDYRSDEGNIADFKIIYFYERNNKGEWIQKINLIKIPNIE